MSIIGGRPFHRAQIWCTFNWILPTDLRQWLLCLENEIRRIEHSSFSFFFGGGAAFAPAYVIRSLSDPVLYFRHLFYWLIVAYCYHGYKFSSFCYHGSFRGTKSEHFINCIVTAVIYAFRTSNRFLVIFASTRLGYRLKLKLSKSRLALGNRSQWTKMVSLLSLSNIGRCEHSLPFLWKDRTII